MAASRQQGRVGHPEAFWRDWPTELNDQANLAEQFLYPGQRPHAVVGVAVQAAETEQDLQPQDVARRRVPPAGLLGHLRPEKTVEPHRLPGMKHLIDVD